MMMAKTNARAIQTALLSKACLKGVTRPWRFRTARSIKSSKRMTALKMIQKISIVDYRSLLLVAALAAMQASTMGFLMQPIKNETAAKGKGKIDAQPLALSHWPLAKTLLPQCSQAANQKPTMETA